PGGTEPGSLPRHCERSEAIHSAACGGVDCFVAFAPRNDADTASRSRGALRPRFASLFALLEIGGRREDRVLAAPAVSRAICANKVHTSIQGSGSIPAFPAQWLYGL